MADLEELAGRVEGLTGPDREVDAEIALAAEFPDWRERTYPGWVNSAQSSWAALNYDAGGNGFPIPAVTASIDAAMTLISGRFPNAILHEAMKRLADKFALHMAMWPENENYAEWLARFITAAAIRSRTQGNSNG